MKAENKAQDGTLLGTVQATLAVRQRGRQTVGLWSAVAARGLLTTSEFNVRLDGPWETGGCKSVDGEGRGTN